MREVPVLIVGGGPVGLTASILLSKQGISSLLVERHSGTAIVPKARGINARTMEMYRQLGIEQAIREAGLAPERTGFIIWTESLAGREIDRRVPGRMARANRAASPVMNCLCAQDDLEPVLRRAAEAQPAAELRFSTEMTAIEQDAEGVSAILTDRLSGRETRVRAAYVIAAEGAQSRIRRMVARQMIGEEGVYDSVNILFNADLRQWVKDRPAALYFVEQPDLRATFLTINAHDRWGFLIHSLKQYGWTPEDFTEERCIALIRQGVGKPDLALKILGISPWEASAIVADRYRERRLFLAGDAAHEMPPTGGFRAQHRRAGCAESVLEAGRGAAGSGGPGAARHLSPGAPAAGADDHAECIGQRPVDGAHCPPGRRQAAAFRIPQRTGPDLRRQLCIKRRDP